VLLHLFFLVVVTLLGASGGFLVAFSIKYGDAILKTLATTGSIVVTAIIDHILLKGPLTFTMMIVLKALRPCAHSFIVHIGT
jgi:hypothetical protein